VGERDLGRAVLRRSLQLALLLGASFIGMYIGVLFYVAETVDIELNPPTQFEDPSFNSSDCYESPEADQLDRLLLWIIVGVPAATTMVAGFGATFAATRARPAPRPRATGLVADGVALVFALLAVMGLSGVAAGVAYGFLIGHLLDPGCINLAVPGRFTTMVAEPLAILGMWRIGAWHERQGETQTVGGRP
jgi:hypothetical protein